MRISFVGGLSIIAVLSVLTMSCKKDATFDDTNFQKDRLTELTIPLQKGKYITYRLDSLVFTNFGRNTEIHSYQLRHVVDTLVTDNLERPSYRIYSYISDSAGTQPWQPNGSYFLTILNDRVEVIEDNMRVIKLLTPIQNGTTWKGNAYLSTEPYAGIYNFSNDDNMTDWDFVIDGDMQSSVTVDSLTYNDVYTVTENEDVDPVVDPSDYGSESVSQEMYSKNVGLVYRELTMWEQQPNPSGNPPNVTYDPYRIGFGIKMWMIDHN